MGLDSFASDFVRALWLLMEGPRQPRWGCDDPRASIWQLGLQHRQLITLNDRGRILKLPIELHL